MRRYYTALGVGATTSPGRDPQRNRDAQVVASLQRANRWVVFSRWRRHPVVPLHRVTVHPAGDVLGRCSRSGAFRVREGA